MSWFSNFIRTARTLKYEMGSRANALIQERDKMAAKSDEELFEFIRKGRLYAENSPQYMKMPMAEKVLEKRGYSDKEIRQKTAS